MRKLVLALATVSVPLPPVSGAATNILVIVADDLGTESLASYGFDYYSGLLRVRYAASARMSSSLISVSRNGGMRYRPSRT